MSDLIPEIIHFEIKELCHEINPHTKAFARIQYLIFFFKLRIPPGVCQSLLFLNIPYLDITIILPKVDLKLIQRRIGKNVETTKNEL